MTRDRLTVDAALREAERRIRADIGIYSESYSLGLETAANIVADLRVALGNAAATLS